jgi:LacI family transcriptional regulator
MVTQEQIADKLGISRQLVTLALAGYPQVSEKSRKRIFAAASKLGYCPNPHARALKQRRTGIIALWVPDQISSHYSHVARELNRLLKREHFELIVSEVGSLGVRQIASNVPMDGVFIVDAPNAARFHLQSPGGRNVPAIYLGAGRCDKMDFIQVDLLSGALQAVQHLIDSGFHRIAHATFIKKDIPAESRRRAYLQAIRQAKLKPEFLYYPLTEQQRPLVRTLVQDYIREQGRPDAIFCHSDDVAIGIYRGLCDLNLSVPTDVALVGCDGIQDCEYLESPLTTLHQPVAEMCAVAWDFLRRRLESPEIKRQGAVLKPKLMIRKSSDRKSKDSCSPVRIGSPSPAHLNC